MKPGVDEEAYSEPARLIGERAGNLFETGQLLCSEAVLCALNRGLGGGLPDETAIKIASALPEGFGKGGCTCGALSGGALALGLFLGRSRPCSRDSGNARPAARTLHDNFKRIFGSSCCRVLSKKVKHDPQAHMRQCTRFTADAAEMAALLILKENPSLLEKVDYEYLRKRDSKIGSRLKQLFAAAVI